MVGYSEQDRDSHNFTVLISVTNFSRENGQVIFMSNYLSLLVNFTKGVVHGNVVSRVAVNPVSDFLVHFDCVLVS